MPIVTMVTKMMSIIRIHNDGDPPTPHHHYHRRYIELTEDDKEKLKGSYKV